MKKETSTQWKNRLVLSMLTILITTSGAAVSKIPACTGTAVDNCYKQHNDQKCITYHDVNHQCGGHYDSTDCFEGGLCKSDSKRPKQEIKHKILRDR